MKIYLAAAYNRMMEMRDVRDFLVNDGHEVTAQWIDGKESNDTSAAAVMDVEDVRRADVLVAFSFERGTLTTGGGRHVEFGIALERGIDIIVCGPKGEHVFHSWPGVRHAPSVDDLARLLQEMNS